MGDSALKSKALVLNKQQKGAIREIEIAGAEKNRLLVKVITAQVDDFDRQAPENPDGVVPGAGVIGVVEQAAGKAGSNFGVEIGDLVFVEPPMPCNRCVACLTGHYSACEKNMRYGTGRATDGVVTGGCSAYMTVAEGSRVHKLPSGIDPRLGGLLTAMGRAFFAASEKGAAGLGKKMLILGSDLPGVLCAISAKACGASSVALVPLTRLDEGLTGWLVDFGVTPAERIPEGTFDVLIDACGIGSLFDEAVAKLNPLGVCVLTAGAAGYGIPGQAVMDREITITGAHEASWCFDQALRFLQSHPELADVIQTLSFSLESFEDAVHAFKQAPYANILIRP